MNIDTTRFGTIEVPQDKLIKMEKPVLGFESCKRFMIVTHEEIEPFVWLQAIEEPEVAFMMVNPALFYPDYKIEVNRKEVEDIEVDDATEIETYAIVSVAENPAEMTINLQGPILINVAQRKAKQLVLANSRYTVAHSLFEQGHQRAPVESNSSAEVTNKSAYAEL